MNQAQSSEYLRRIGAIDVLDGQPNLDLLQYLSERHQYTIPFENLGIHYDPRLQFDLDWIFQKVVREGRGGFCYELNGIFFELLLGLGFQAHRIMGQVWSRKKQTYGLPFDHLASLVQLNNKQYLTDVGFGEFALHPLLLEVDTIQEDRRGSYRIVQHEKEQLRIEHFSKNDWLPVFIFEEKAYDFEAFREGFDFHTTSPESTFTQKKICSLAKSNGRITLKHDEFLEKIGEEELVSPIDSETAFLAKLEQEFSIKLGN